MIRALLLLTCITFSAASQGAAPNDDLGAVAPFESMIKVGSLSEAQSALESYIAQHPDSWRAQYQLGYVYFRLHKIQPSVVHLCKSLLINEGFGEAHKILALDLNILGHPDRAILELQRAIRIDPTAAESQYELGRIYYEQGNYVRAIGHLEQAKLLLPDSVRIYHNLGLAYAAVSENGKAVDNFDEGLRRNRQQSKQSAWPLIDYGTYFNLQGDFKKARTMLLEAIAIDPQWDQAFDELSKADRGLGEIQDSIVALQHAIALNKFKPEYHYVLAQLYKQTHRSTEAQEELTRYREFRPATQAP